MKLMSSMTIPLKIGDEKKRPMCRHITPIKGKSSDFRPAPKKLPGGLNVRISFRGYSIVQCLCKNTQNILWCLPPIESCGISMEFKPTPRFSVASLVLVRFAAVTSPAAPERRRHATPNRPFRRHSSLPKANRGPWKVPEMGRCFLPMLFSFGGKNRSVFFGQPVDNGGVCFFSPAIWKICDMSA